MLTLFAATGAIIASSPSLGMAQGMCRAAEPGPAFVVTAQGLKDRTGRIKLELYPNNDGDFLADDNKLIAAGKAFARVDQPLPPEGPVKLCIRAPGPGRYALLLLHDRDADHKFGFSSDGIGFSNNPVLGWSKPKAAKAGIAIDKGIENISIILNYRRGFSMRPLEAK